MLITNEVLNQTTVVRLYKGSQSLASAAYRADAVKMAKLGYEATGQVWSGGAYGTGAFLLALILCFVIIGFLIFVYMLIVPPQGTLTVTYTKLASAENEKVCPDCAEKVKEAASICRYCRHEFVQSTIAMAPLLRDLGVYTPPPPRGAKAESFGRKLGSFYLKVFSKRK